MIKTMTGMRLSDEGKRLLQEFSEYYGISKTGVMEILLREAAERGGIVSMSAARRRQRHESAPERTTGDLFWPGR